jgi:hypothetical protein
MHINTIKPKVEITWEDKKLSLSDLNKLRDILHEKFPKLYVVIIALSGDRSIMKVIVNVDYFTVESIINNVELGLKIIGK